MDKGKKLEEPQTSSNSYYLRSSISSAPGISPLRIESRRDSCGSESTISVNHSIDSLGTEQAMSDQPPTWLADLASPGFSVSTGSDGYARAEWQTSGGAVYQN